MFLDMVTQLYKGRSLVVAVALSVALLSIAACATSDERAVRTYQKGLEYYDSGRYSDAEAEFSKAYDMILDWKIPSDYLAGYNHAVKARNVSRTLIFRARTRIRQNRLEDALKDLDSAVIHGSQDPKFSVRAHLLRAHVHHDLKLYVKSIEDADWVLSRGPASEVQVSQRVEALVTRCSAKLATQGASTARPDCLEALRLDAGDETAANLLSLIERGTLSNHPLTKQFLYCASHVVFLERLADGEAMKAGLRSTSVELIGAANGFSSVTLGYDDVQREMTRYQADLTAAIDSRTDIEFLKKTTDFCDALRKTHGG